MRYSPNSDRSLAKDTEFRERLTRHTMTGENMKSAGVPLLVDKETVYTDDSDNHVLIFGNTGSKKSRNFIIPSVYLLAQAGENMVISDPKGEIYRNSSGALLENGYKIRIINFRDMEKSDRWNPLLLPYTLYRSGDVDKAVELVTDLAYQLTSKVRNRDDKFWESQAAEAIIGLILALFETEDDPNAVNMKSVLVMRGYIELEPYEREPKPFWDYVRSFPIDSFVRTKLSSLYALRMTEKTLNCILATMDSMLSTFSVNQQLLGLTAATDIDRESIFCEKTAVFLITPDEKTIFNFLVSVFVKEYYEMMIERAQTMPNGMLSRRINFILDEFSNFPRIEDMPAMISAARSRNIRFVLVVQSKQQLTSMYKDDAETIKSNCKNWVFLASREIGLLNEISDLCGKYMNRRGISEPILSVMQLQQLRNGWEESEALILRQNCKPFITTVKDFSCYPQSRYNTVEIAARKGLGSSLKFFSIEKYMSDREKRESERIIKALGELFE